MMIHLVQILQILSLATVFGFGMGISGNSFSLYLSDTFHSRLLSLLLVIGIEKFS